MCICRKEFLHLTYYTLKPKIELFCSKNYRLIIAAFFVVPFGAVHVLYNLINNIINIQFNSSKSFAP